MEPDFWHRRWKKNEIGFHENEGNTLLTDDGPNNLVCTNIYWGSRDML